MGSKIKLVVVSPYYLPHMGGLEIHAHEFNTHAALRGHQILVWTARLPKTALQYEELDSIRIYRYEAIELIGGFPIPAVWLPSFWKQYREIFKNDYDYVLSRTRFFLSSLLALYIGKIKKIPMIHVEHGSDYVRLTNYFSKKVAYVYDKTFGKMVLQHSNIVVANSRASSLFVEHLTNGKTHPTIIYRGVDEQGIINVQPIHVRPNTVTICFSGRLISGKGVQDLIQAISQLTNDHTIVCWIIGEGPMKAELERLSAEKRCSERIQFLGKMDNKDAIVYIKSCDIFVNPSYTEGIPTSVIEAALCKKAIIATGVGGTMEIIEDGISGLLIEPHNSNQLREALQLLIQDDSLRTSLGEHAYTQNTKKFLWERAMNEYETILR